ncbi:MAG: hypothetical protein ACYC5Y_02615 [Symbiobacteriia bacterium]
MPLTGWPTAAPAQMGIPGHMGFPGQMGAPGQMGFPGQMGAPGFPMSAPMQMMPGVAAPMRPTVPGPQFTNIPTAPLGTSPAPTMTTMPSFVPPGFPMQMPVQGAAAPWGARPMAGSPSQLSAAVPGVSAAPVAGVSPGGFPIPQMPGLPLPGGAFPPQTQPAQLATPQGSPAAPQSPYGAPQMPYGTQQMPFGARQMPYGVPQLPAGFAAPAAPTSWAPPVLDAGTLAQAIVQQPTLQSALSSWANTWMASPEFKTRLGEALKSKEIPAAPPKDGES